MAENLLHIENLSVSVVVEKQKKLLVENLSLSIPPLSIVALVGGSGSGKTTTGLSILRLLPLGLEIDQGKIHYNGSDLLEKTPEQMRKLRGEDISMVFQEPLHAFNPVFTVGYQIDEVLQYHTELTAKQRPQRILELLDMAGIKDPQRVANTFPHQLSGGMRQRAMIAQAIAGDPKLIIADEPTSNLDVTLQARIMELFKKLRQKLGLSILLISHDLGMVSHLSDRITIMHQGKVVESGYTNEIVNNPQQPYTKELMKAFQD